MRLQNLADVHTRRHAQRIQNDLDRRSIRQVRHVFFRQNAGDHALVTVTAGHLVADRKLALHRDEDLDHLDHARRKLVALLQLGDLLVMKMPQNLDLSFGAVFDSLISACTSTRGAGDLDLCAARPISSSLQILKQ